MKFRKIGLTAASLATTLAVLSGCGMISARPAMTGDRGFSAMVFSERNEMLPAVLHFGNADLLTKMVQAGMDVWTVDVKGKRAKGTMNQTQMELAKSLGMSVEALPKQSMNLKVDKGYRSFDALASRMRELAAKAPDFVHLEDIGDSWEKTQGKAPSHDIIAMRIGKGSGKPVVTIVGCTHAREIVTPEMVMMEAENLVENYGKDPAVTAAVDNREIWLVPMVNPDGHGHAMQGESWRKNTNNVTGGKSHWGVDLNRNYGSFWGTIGDSSNPDSDTFRGAGPFSEPESQAIRDFTTRHKPAIYMTFHSFSNCVMWPWDHSHEAPPNKLLAPIGQAMGKLSGYDAYQGSEMYLNGGDDEEWVFEKLGSLAFTIEIGTWSDGFMPSFSKIQKFWGENSKMMAYALQIADNPAAVHGPKVAVETGRGGLSVSAKGARAAEVFTGHVGAPGTGTPVSLNSGRAFLPAPAAEGGRQLVYVRAQGMNGVWGPTEAVFSN